MIFQMGDVVLFFNEETHYQGNFVYFEIVTFVPRTCLCITNGTHHLKVKYGAKWNFKYWFMRKA